MVPLRIIANNYIQSFATNSAVSDFPCSLRLFCSKYEFHDDLLD